MAVIKDRYVLDIDTRGATSAINGLGTAVKGFIAVIAVDQIRQFGQAIIDSTKQFQSFNNQLRLITDSQDELDTLFNKLTQSAKNNRAAFGDTVDLFTKLTLATADLGIEQDRIINVTERFQQALAISGADANTSAGAIRQFGQAMASGTVRGDEFNSIVEALGPALSIMAQESGLSVGKLRQMSQAGELTAETFFKMVESSNALGAAFNKTEPTIDNLETALSDAFDRVLIKIGQASGATEAYESILKSLTRTADQISGTEGALANLDAGQVMQQVEEGSISATAAVEELEAKIGDLVAEASGGSGRFFGFFGDDLEERKAELDNFIVSLKEQIEVEKELAEAAEAEAKAIQEQRAALEQVLAPHKQFIEQAQKFADSDYRTELEKANQRVIDAEIVIEQLNLAFERSNGQVDNFVLLLRGAQNELNVAQGAVSELTNEAARLANEGSFNQFYEQVIGRAKDAQTDVEFTQQAINRLGQELEAGRISIDTYAFAMEQLVDNFKEADTTAEELEARLKSLADATNNSIASIQARIAQSEEAAQLSGLQGLERDLKRIELEEIRLAEAAKERIRAQSEGLDASEIERQLARIDAASQEAIRSRQAAQRTIENNEERFRKIEEDRRAAAKAAEEATANQQKSFAEGWSDAFDAYSKEANDAGKAAERLFSKSTKGMEDAIVGFAKTGKFEFKSLVSTILEELLRSQIRQLIASTFGGFGGGSGGSGGNSLFGGFFASGGYLPAGKIGVVGEQGPELINGPANISPINGLGGTNNVTYNINAVDALSFRQMVARDPGFIHAVAQKGGAAAPMGR